MDVSFVVETAGDDSIVVFTADDDNGADGRKLIIITLITINTIIILFLWCFIIV